jgi:hypothetical protein
MSCIKTFNKFHLYSSYKNIILPKFTCFQNCEQYVSSLGKENDKADSISTAAEKMIINRVYK